MGSVATPGSEGAPPRIGSRFILKGERGTVRYVGPVPPAKGDWLRVEWDDAARGKHDGLSADGTRYFHCRQPGAGSFLRPSGKVKLDWGTSFIQALRSRYALVPTFNAADTQQKAKHSRRNLAEIEIEVPNVDALFQKELVLDRLRVVAVGSRAEAAPVSSALSTGDDVTASRIEVEEGEAEKEVSCAFDSEAGEQPGDIKRAIPNVKELDMSRSLIPSWEETSNVTRELPWLDTLLLHFNRFSPLRVAPAADSFVNIRHLGLDGTLISWSEVLVLSSSLPRIERLELRRNNLRRFHPTGQGKTMASEEPGSIAPLQTLRSLHLQENQLEHWLDLVTALAPLPQLDQIVLSSNQFSNIPPPAAHDGRRFPALTQIAIDGNPLNSWSDVDALGAWCCSPAGSNPNRSERPTNDPLTASSLTYFSIGGAQGSAPFASGMDPRDLRAIAIARLPSLQNINGSLIRAAERRDAEIWYLGRIAEERLDEGTLKARHPRYEALSLVHDFTKQDSAKRAQVEETETLRSKLLELEVYVVHSVPPRLSDAEAKGSVKLLGTSAIRTSMTKIAKACGVKPRDVKELWASLSPTARMTEEEEAQDQGEGGEDADQRITICLDNLTKELGWFGVQNGDYLFVVL
ncbi:hypothetical protein A4X03_0g1079 [Tilletia caries]|uniref:CAP-Gly domain-containing protein n=1 Tax=Tilletia caries TaxID=13290 RepID=A0A8T8TP34_9BASI|nr:hypothetical protein A4X03_0g1079 [Tilletia caries]